jgi:hypothetical protein
LVSLNLSATETTDNLLTNNTFDENTSGWTLSDSNVKRDANSYSDAGNSPTIRFKGQTSTISQLVNLTGIEEGKEIKSYTLSYNGYGCGNAPGGWCNDGSEDTVITNITFTDGTTTEVSSNVITVPYADGWVYHTFTKSINDLFLTGNVAVNFELTGIDTGNSSSWLGPITDNYEFLITYDDYVQQQVEEEIETMIGGLELSTEVTLDLIQDIQVMPEMEMEMTMDMPEIEMDMSGIPNETSIDMPDMIDMPPLIQEIRMEMTVDIPEIIDIEPIQEIQEIKIEIVETETKQPEMEEIKDERREIKQEAESEIDTAKTETKQGSDIRESESDSGEEREGETEESTADSDKGDESKETTTVAKTKDTNTKSTGGSKDTTKTKPKPKAKDNVQDDRLTGTSKKTNRKVKAKLPVNTAKPKTIEQLPLPIAYLQIISDSISMVETISLRQEQIYGGEQEYNLNTGGITVAGLDNNSSSRWSNLQDVSKRYQAPKYNNRYKEN